MANQMLVDATHPEETRVVVVRGNRVEEFDFESANRKQLRGNIYLAKVTRVEPSLQAAFVDYGGNRHGFLAFSEIHPDYYQIPVADRQALLEEEKGHHSDDDDHTEESSAPSKKRKRGKGKSKRAKARENQDSDASSDKGNATEGQGEEDGSSEAEALSATVAIETSGEASGSDAPGNDTSGASAPDEADGTQTDTEAAPVEAASGQETPAEAETTASDSDDETTPPAQTHPVAAEESVSADPDDIEEAEELDDNERVSFDAHNEDDEDEDGDDDHGDVEHVGAEDAMEEVPERRSRRRVRQYKIQEVIKRRQILLVQVVKEERGNKGAALTTYLSLAGRYSVLMPNTARGGGISRKITNPTDRKRLKQVASELEVADGMGVILRTAGASRTKTEIKRDFEYLLRLWENVRDLTLKSAAPLLVYEEGSLIKRSIRDLYNKDIDQVLVSGEEGYKEAKGFMRMLMPSHARNVQPYREPQPIFTRMGIESQLDAMFSPQVTLKSGGYIVIDQTEALVSIDVNSGRSTREHNIEDTALSTNLEAAEEISRQLRLRDLAGLVVIDFIDMEEKRNNRAVEKRLKDCLKSDRARIQVGRISHFGLMEMSRQRIRTGVLESTMDPCPHCHGTGYVRAAASVALLVLRTIEDHLLKGVTHHMVVKTRTNVALYILNQKRNNLFELENRFGVHITIEVDDHLEGKHLEIERGEPLEQPVAPTPTVSMQMTDDLDEAFAVDLEEEKDAEEESSSKKRRRRRRRKKAGPSDSGNRELEAAESDEETSEAEEVSEEQDAKGEEDGEDKPKKSRRRGRRGGRRNRRGRSGETESEIETTSEDTDASEALEAPEALETTEQSVEGEPTAETTDAEGAMFPAATSSEGSDNGNQNISETPVEVATESAGSADSPEAETPEAEKNMSETPAPQQDDAAAPEAETGDVVAEPQQATAEPEQEEETEEARPKRTGWWNRSGFL